MGNSWRPSQKGKAKTGYFVEHVGEVHAKITSRYNRMHENLQDLSLESIQNGSAITGAKGQPVDEFQLLPSYHIERLGDRTSRIISYLPYAWGIEIGIGPHGPITLRSSVGGFHSIKITVSAIDKLARVALQMTEARG